MRINNSPTSRKQPVVTLATDSFQTKNTKLLKSICLVSLTFAMTINQAAAQCSAGEYYNSGTCYNCPAGYYCADGTNQVACSSNQFSFNGDSSCTDCPAGYSCASTSSTPVACSAGQYSPQGTSTCLSCDAGYYCATPASSSETACASGFYSAANAVQCMPCPSGSQCTTTTVTACSSGYYSLGQATSCTQCPAGYQCSTTSGDPVQCPSGYYSLAGSTTCTICPAGSYCSTPSSTPVTCNSGQYSVAGSTACTNCPAGFSCSSAGSLPTICPEGYFSDASASSCTACSAGYYCPDKSSSAAMTACPSGFYSIGSQINCKECPAGYQCSNSAVAPVACSTGYYSLTGSTSCTQCPAGYACTSQYEAPTACPSGYYSNAGDTTCTLCPAGSYCPTTTAAITCSTTGATCIAGSTTQDQCPSKYGCISVSAQPAICASGYYPDPTSKQCVTCPAGYVCTDRQTSVLVTIGFYSPASAIEEYVCPAGYSCLDTSTGLYSLLTACASGQYANEGDGVCTDCPLGYACPSQTSSLKMIDCTALDGYYTDSTKLTQCKICPAGYYCPAGTQDKQACAAGTYAVQGSSDCKVCPPGFQCPLATTEQMTPCTLGTYSPGGLSACLTCPAGYSCSNIATFACPTYMTSEEGDGYCSYFIAETNSVSISNNVVTYLECDAGQFKLFGTLGCVDCPIGHYCPQKNGAPVKCPPGTFQDTEKQTSCQSCPTTDGSGNAAAYYSVYAEISCHLCPAGHFCPTSASVPQQCQLGYYSEAGSTSCTNCDDGYICRFREQVSNPTYSLCPVGFYCKADMPNNGKLIQMPCPAGYYQPFRGQTSSSACISCPAGTYCPTASETPRNCTPGSFCIVNTISNQAYQCPGGSFSTVFMGTSTSICQTCPAGYYCPQGANYPVKCPTGYYCESGQESGKENPCPSGTYSGIFSIQDRSDCLTCPSGFYCPTASTLPTPCLNGTYNQYTGQKTSSACLSCPARKPCPYYGQSTYENGLYCAHGNYCPAGTSFPNQYPCPAGTYSDSINITLITDCTTCPQKFACYEGTNTLTNQKVPCSPGYYCPAGTQYPNQYPCPAGTYSPFTDNYVIDQCIVCPAGYYCSAGSSTPTGLCSPGYYCPQGSSLPTSQPCPAGHYQPNSGARSLGECQICPIGSYCLATSTAPTACPAGTYGPVAALEIPLNSSTTWGCHACPEGYQCPTTGMIDPIVCGKGYWSLASQTSCTLCTLDYYCANITTTQTEMLNSKCDYGYICPAGTSVMPFIPDYACPKGQYCQNSQIFDCPAGTYNPVQGAANSSYCMQTPAGYYNDQAASSDYHENICPQGYYCPAGSTNPYQYQCPSGSFRNMEGATQSSDCGICPTGHYCPTETVETFQCPTGYYCPEGSVYATPCPIGTFGASPGLREISDCTACYAGRYCSQEGLSLPDGLCDAGYYCITGAFTATPTDGVTGNICSAGGYCVLGSKKPASCPAGTYNPNTGAPDVSYCQPCIAGYYCSGSNNPTPTGQCYAGYYCLAGSQFPNEYPASQGTYTLAGDSAERQCSPGTYNPYIAQSSCQNCPAGYMCPNSGMYQLTDCSTGGYCPSGSSGPTACPAGTFNALTNGQSVSDCQACLSGQYCGTTGLTAPSGDCAAGYFCLSGASSSTPSLDPNGQYGPCPQGYYCGAATGAPVPCPSGTFGASTGLTQASSCTQCTAGYYCNSGGLSAPQGQCSPGYYCPTGTNTMRPLTTFCTAGQYCPQGSSVPISCAAGTYQNQVKQSSCITCPKGYYCPLQTSDFTYNPCPAGYYCPAGTQSANQYACPVGTYNVKTKAQSLNDCILCDPGKYCGTTTAQSAVVSDCPQGQFCMLGAISTGSSNVTNAFSATLSGVCPMGYYCPLGSSFPIPCPPGFQCNVYGCIAPAQCPQGYYCQGLTINNILTCPAGSYCPTGVSDPIDCPAGTYSSSTGQYDVTQCASCTASYTCPTIGMTTYGVPCPAGYYCPGGQRTGTELICQPGYRCPAQSSAMIPCSGTSEYQDDYGASVCKTCPAGFECTDSTITRCQPQKNAVLSYYCTGTIRTRQYCPPGTFDNTDRSSSLADCIACPPGYYCPNNPSDPTATKKIIECPAGSYCLQGSAVGITCPIGFYCPTGTNAPIPCQAGSYCDTTGLLLPAGDCAAGYYCSYEKVLPSVVDVVNGKAACADYQSPYCIRGSITSTQNICPAGYYCPIGSDVATACPIGTFSSTTGLTDVSQCTPCTAGKFCRHLGETSPDSDCAAGFYCPTGTSTDMPTAYECDQGYYCPQGVDQEIECPIGTYQPNKRQASCLTCPNGFICESTAMIYPDICPMGYYCSSGNVNKQPCPAGFYSEFEGLITVSQCQICKNGMYCASPASTAPTGYCDPGYYCTASATSPITTSTPAAFVCPTGAYCPQNSTIPTKCPPGTYNLNTQMTSISDCLACPKGYICDSYGIGSSTSMKICPLGYYCLSAAKDNSTIGVAINVCDPGYYCDSSISFDPIPCPLGTYNPMSGQSICLACPAGKLCNQLSLATPLPCPKGSYCPVGSTTSGLSNEVKCPAGTTNAYENLLSVSQCQICPKGSYCLIGESQATGTDYCDAGFLCDQGAKSAQDSTKVCPMGHYCPAGATYPEPCSPGTYIDFTGAASVSQCQPCPASTYTGHFGASSCSACSDGFVCFTGSNTTKPTDGIMGRLCEQGHYCKAGVEYPCANYTYQNLEGQTSCFSCPLGYNCATDNINTNPVTVPVLCEATYFCRYGYQELCLNGTYANSGMKGLEDPDQCIPCPTGYYCVNGVLDTLKQACDPGFFCLSGAVSANDTNNLCPAGFYCDSYPTLMPIKCPNGTFSVAGASSLSNCTNCTAGYYCMDGSSQKYDCPLGNYCPAGTGNPIPCPKGTYNGQTNGQSLFDCATCPAGALCNITGIANPADYLCPPGYYCVRGALQAVACSAGTYRGVNGGSSSASCSLCDAGYYCNSVAQVVPMLCANGTFCPVGSLSPTACPPGYYCPAKSGSPIKCPAGFYCPGRSELYFKCQNGTYCPAGSSAPIICPGGTFGSGYANNANLSISCDTCGRGQYSTQDQLGICFDCTPGYVCLGSTNSATPQSVAANNGYICPAGSYCPSGSYKEISCPVGTYNKYEGRSSLSDCLNCKVGYYNDLLGQAGCKLCGPSSTSDEGATTCTCIGKNRRFIKSIGACLCENGYKAKDNKTDSDSVNDCEAKSKPTCADGQEIDIEGNCVTSSDSVCASQCSSGNGTLVEGTGVCTCSAIVDPDQVCNSTCRANQVQMTMQASGNVTVYEPTTNKTSSIDPTNLSGYIGDYKCQQTNQSLCKVYTLGASSSSGFSYNYQSDSSLVASSGIKKTSRMLQTTSTTSSTNTTSITNPVMCIIQENSVLFQVNSASQMYPVYYKDSILNTNKDFDYGPFIELQQTIQKGTTVNAFSYIFKDTGIYVFYQSTDQSKFTIIGVVATDQQCSNSDANVQAATAASLASIGIVSQPKVVNPEWSFIIGVFVFIILFSFGVVTFIILMHNRNSAQNSKSSQTNQKKNNIYYDRIEDLESHERNQRKWYYCLCKRFQEFSRGAKVMPTEEVDISYQDLEKLLAEFKESMDVLKQKMKEDGQKDREPAVEGEEEQNEEDLLIQELNGLRKFVYDNKECIEDFFDIHRGDQNKDQNKDHDNNSDQDDLNNSRSLDFDHKDGHGKDEIGNLLRDQQNQEEYIMNKLQNGINNLRENLLNEIRDKNDDEINRLMDEFKNKISSAANGLSEQEKQDLINEMQHRLGKVEDIMLSEESSQDKKLQDALARRKKKKEQLAKVMVQLNVAKQDDNKLFSDNMEKIAQLEQEELEKLESDIEQEKAKGLKDIEQDLKKNRSERLADMEKKLEMLRKQRDGSSKNGVEFGDMLNEYGKLVKKVEEELEMQKQKQTSELEEKLKRRREERKKAIQEAKKDREEKFHQELSNKNKSLTDNIDQIKQLLKPVVNEDQRIQALLDANPDILKPVIRPGDGEDEDLQLLAQNKETQLVLAPYQKQMELVQEEEDQRIQRLVEDMRKQSEKLARDNELQKQTLLRKIEMTSDPNERKRLLDQFDKLKQQIEDVQNREVDQQNDKLREALRQRKLRKAKINDKVKEVTQVQILKEVDDRNKQMIDLNTNIDDSNQQLSLADIEKMAQKLGQKFEKDELVQVAENFLDQKHLRELQEYMLALFEERARGLRKYIFELMTQKQTELELIREEFAPQYQFLKDRKAAGLINEQQYRDMMAKLQDEENERRIDAEIGLKELEQKMEEELMIQSVKNKNEAEQAFKDRQSEEKVKMIDYLIDNNSGNDAIRQYLEKEKKDTLKELVEFKKQKEKEKQQKLKDIEKMREAREKELQEKEDRMLNWEERMKQEEAKHMEAFEKQKNAILSKKLKEQQNELLREVNKDEIDKLLSQHKRDLANLETALEREQQRQLENMRANMGERLKVQETGKVKREIKMAQLIKDKDTRQKEMLNISATGSQRSRGSLPPSTRNEDQVKLLTEKARIMQRPIDKKPYCGKGANIYVKEYQIKKIQLQNKLLKRDERSQMIQSVLDTASKQGGATTAQDAQSILLRAQSQISDDSFQQESVSSFALQNLTFKELIEHVDRIETNYQQITKKIHEQNI